MKERGGIKDKRKLGFLLITIGPAFVCYCIFTLWPNLMSGYYSLLDWNGVSEATFVGLKNFVTLLSDSRVWRGLWINLCILVVTVPVTILFALLLAFALTNTKFRENKFYKVLFFLPNVLPVVVVALLWSFIYDGDMGLLNGILGLVTSKWEGKFWLADKSTALICIMIPMIWCNVGFHMILYINAMDSIPQSLYEVATLEGATMLQKLRYVTVPLIRGTVMVSAVFLMLGAFRNFELIMLMTNGGPSGSTTTLGLYMYTLAFGSGVSGMNTVHLYGYSSAVGMLLMAVLLLIKFLMDKFTKADAVQY